MSDARLLLMRVACVGAGKPGLGSMSLGAVSRLS